MVRRLGKAKDFAPGDKLANLSGWAGDIYEAAGLSSFLSTLLEGVGIVFLATHINFDLDVYALPDNPSNYTKVYKGKTFVAVLGGLLAANATNFEGKVKETVPYDSAPGGYLPIDLDDMLGFVNVIHPNVCFVPTVSSLDITSPENEDLYQDLSDVGTVTGSGLSLTDRYDASTDDNFESAHNQAHASLNSTNIPFLMAELASEDDLPELPLNGNGELVLGNRTYNYGDAEGHYDPKSPASIRHTPHQLKQTLWVENIGKLWVNRDDRISFTDATDNPNNSIGSHFDLFIEGQDGCELANAELHIENNGTMRIGESSVFNTADVYVKGGSKVFVRNAGELYLEDKSHLIVDGGAEVILGSGGLYQSHWTAETYVREGGIFRVEAGGQLRMLDFSKLLVEPGGQLILEDGAVVQLWDPLNADGEATIHIQGELVIDGDFDFSGSGFFQFDAGHLLTIANGAEFRLEGMGKGTRFMRLNDGARLKTEEHLVRLSDGKVEYEQGSAIALGDGGTAIFSEVEFIDLNDPGKADALLAPVSPNMISVSGSSFTNLVTGISASDILGTAITGSYSRYLRVADCDFTNCEYGVFVKNTPSVEISNSVFVNGSNPSSYGLSLESVNSAYVKNSSFSGFADAAIGAVFLQDVENYNMVGGVVDANATGIKAIGESNIDMTSGATVASNSIGIEMDGGLSFGVLTMDCARLLDNGIGVLGDDITLNIDASGELKPNHFRTAFGSPLFKICYAQLGSSIGNEIEAKDNFWEGDVYYLIYNPAAPYFVTCNYWTGNVNLLINPQSLTTTCSNGPGVPTDPEPEPDETDSNFTGDDPGCHDYDNQLIYDDYWQAYDAYLQEAHYEFSDRSMSDSLYYQIASIPDGSSQYYDPKCRQLVHIARSRVGFTSGINLTGGNNEDGGVSQTSTVEHSQLEVFPNPVKGTFVVQLGSGDYEIKVFNVFGRMVYGEKFSDFTKVPVSDWGQGLYFVEVVDLKSKEKMSHKISVL